MLGKTNVGGVKLYAAIGVVYPEGTRCSCSNGLREFSAENTSGQWVFAVPEPGSWTLTATDPTGTEAPISETVDISSEGQSVNVELSYGLILFNRSDERSATTGGWQAVGGYAGTQGWPGRAPTVTKNTDSYKLSFPANAGSIFSTTNEIDLSDYKTLKALLQHDAAVNLTVDQYMFGVFDIDTLGMNGMQNAIAKLAIKDAPIGQIVELSIDVTTVLGAYNIGFAHYAGTVDVIDKLLKVWAVK